MDKQLAGTADDSADTRRGAESDAKRGGFFRRYAALIVFISLAALSFIFSNPVAQRFRIHDFQGAGNSSILAVIDDSKTYRSYPIFELTDGQNPWIGVANISGGYCVAAELGRVSK